MNYAYDGQRCFIRWVRYGPEGISSESVLPCTVLVAAGCMARVEGTYPSGERFTRWMDVANLISEETVAAAVEKALKKPEPAPESPLLKFKAGETIRIRPIGPPAQGVFLHVRKRKAAPR